MPRSPEAVRAAEAEATRLGASFTWDYSKKHIVGIVCYNNQQRKIFISKTADPFRITNLVKEDIRRKVNELKGIAR